MKKKSLLLATTLLCLTSLVGCGKKTDFTVGICQLVTHDALDKASQGFMDKLTELVEARGKTISFDMQNADGDSTVCSAITNKFVSKNVDLMLAVATPALQAAYNSTTTIPILGTAITEYGVATGHTIVDGVLGINVSGTSDLCDLEDQKQSMLEIFPEVSSVGLIYCSAEANSLYQVDKMKELLEASGISATKYSFSDSNDIQSVCNSAVNNDLIYIPTDNACASNAEIIDNTFRSKNIPVFCGEEGSCKTCGVATLSISYYELGKVTGEMAAEILLEGKDITTMAVRYDNNPVKKFNKEITDLFGITEKVRQLGYVEL